MAVRCQAQVILREPMAFLAFAMTIATLGTEMMFAP
jgi:hypothetical protein